jgi:hypothetical protein
MNAGLALLRDLVCDIPDPAGSRISQASFQYKLWCNLLKPVTPRATYTYTAPTTASTTTYTHTVAAHAHTTHAHAHAATNAHTNAHTNAGAHTRGSTSPCPGHSEMWRGRVPID